jgi:hypothetical protein
MAVYLDTNVIPERGHIPTLELATLAAMAQEHGLSVVLPRLVVDESVARYHRGVVGAQDKLRSGLVEASSFWPPDALFMPDPSELSRERRLLLESLYEVAELSDGAAQEGLQRELWRTPPAREGKGARDAAIWLSVVEHHTSTGQLGYFVSRNTKDFGDAAGGFKHELRMEIAGQQHSLEYCTSPASLFALLGVKADLATTIQEVQSSELITSAVSRFVSESGLYLAVAEQAFPGSVALYLASPVVAVASELGEAQGYSVGDTMVSVGWSTWVIECEIGALHRFAGGGHAQTTMRVRGDCQFQLIIRLNADSREVLSAEVTGQRNCTLRPDPSAS